METVFIIMLVTVFATLAIEAGIQDRIKFKDATWFAWAHRHISNAVNKQRINKATKTTK